MAERRAGNELVAPQIDLYKLSLNGVLEFFP